jgi:hypothetical protein
MSTTSAAAHNTAVCASAPSSAPACRVAVEYCGGCGFEPKYLELKVQHTVAHTAQAAVHSCCNNDMIHRCLTSNSTLPCRTAQSFLESQFPGQLRSITGEPGRTGSFEISIVSQRDSRANSLPAAASLSFSPSLFTSLTPLSFLCGAG